MTKVCNLVTTFVPSFALTNIDWMAYMVFGAADRVMVVSELIFWGETQGLSLGEINTEFGGLQAVVSGLESQTISEKANDGFDRAKKQVIPAASSPGSGRGVFLLSRVSGRLISQQSCQLLPKAKSRGAKGVRPIVQVLAI
ncbi:hypothetical protein BJY00DRAFT_318371 [Aspergillus carlsbadensis]|nr:hypothetical protein BJY00DRAFT_318371 [Aspergillus carlsbadensis]